TMTANSSPPSLNVFWEPAVIVSDDKDLDLNARATDIFKALSSPSTCDGHVVFPAATIGGALEETETNPDQIRQNADVALYH
ncbi:hypothetical protein ACCS53_38885, partial [Rhizobium ruizarguesonis]